MPRAQVDGAPALAPSSTREVRPAVAVARQSRAFLDAPVFSVAGEWYTWRDVIDDAEADDWWGAAVRDAAAGIACQDRSEQNDTSAVAGLHDAVDAAAVAFRYEHGLISAEEAETWLARHGLAITEWVDSLSRRIIRHRWRGPEPAVTASPAAIERAAWVDAVISGEAGRRARRFAERIAGALAAGAVFDRTDPDRFADALRCGVNRLAELATRPDAIRREVVSRRLDWIRVEGLAVEFTTREQAAEAIMCVNDDDACIEVTARLASARTSAATLFACDIDADCRTAIVSAMPGEVVGPFASETGYRIMRVDRKILPEPEDPAILERARLSLIAGALRRESRARVIWLID